jgi:hypothetical protein
MQHLQPGTNWAPIEEWAVLEGGEARKDIAYSVRREPVRDESHCALG